ncbi:MAG: hypothetical protein H6701_09800 [Myxococcales bacterium]|nr:hypothetical protein [Myxococcales bacterium]MCB9551034.1 hypothetical protein [Myxococcales bacterium]
MFIDFTGVLAALLAACVLPLIIGFILRARRRYLAARVAAGLSAAVILAFELLLPGPGSALFLTGVPLLVAVALFVSSFEKPPADH